MSVTTDAHLNLSDEQLKLMASVLQEQLESAKVVKLIPRNKYDHHTDEAYINLLVVFEAKDDRLDPRKLLSLFSQAKDVFQHIDIDTVPIFSFSTQKELKSIGY